MHILQAAWAVLFVLAAIKAEQMQVWCCCRLAKAEQMHSLLAAHVPLLTSCKPWRLLTPHDNCCLKHAFLCLLEDVGPSLSKTHGSPQHGDDVQ